MKKLISESSLCFIAPERDSRLGSGGFVHKDNFTQQPIKVFDPFYDELGLFHDLLEHHFEDKNKYFKGDHAYNHAGEVTAMGAASYLYHTFGLTKRYEGGAYIPFDEAIAKTCTDTSEEAMQYHLHEFGETINCNLPYQKPISYLQDMPIHSKGLLEMAENELHAQVDKLLLSFDPRDPLEEKARNFLGIRDHEIHASHQITRSIYLRYFRYGIRMAKKLFPYTEYNLVKLNQLYDFLSEFVSMVKGHEETFDYAVRDITFRVYASNGKNRDWTMTLNGRYPFDDLIYNGSLHIDFMDFHEEKLEMY